MEAIKEALTFDDVLLLPRYSEVLPSDTDISLDLTKNISHKGKCLYEEVYQSSRTQDGAISAYLLGEEIIPPNKDPNPITKMVLSEDHFCDGGY